nr:hypothetical protein [Tanacetum cinerariifolium]
MATKNLTNDGKTCGANLKDTNLHTLTELDTNVGILGPTSYAKLVTGKPSRKSVNVRTLIAPAENGADVAILLVSIRAISQHYANMVYDIIMVAMPKLVSEGFYVSTIHVEFEWKPPTCSSYEVFGQVLKECRKKVVSKVVKNLKNSKEATQEKPTESEASEQIVDFLSAHTLRYALTVNPTIYDSCIEQFWSTVMAKTINEESQIHARVDGKKIVITKSSVRRDLELADKDGVDCLLNSTIFENLELMGPKTTAWNEFRSIMASVIIYLATNQKFNFSKLIFDSMIKNLDNFSGKFLMYPRFVQIFLDQHLKNFSSHKRINIASSHTKKNFANMRKARKGFLGRITNLFPSMLVQNPVSEGLALPPDPQHTPTLLQSSSSQPQKSQKPRKPKRKKTQIPQPSGSTEHVADEVVYKELDDRLVRAATIASSLEAEQDSSNINKTQSKETPNESSSQGTDSCGGPKCQKSMEDTIAQTRFENMSKLCNDSLLARDKQSLGKNASKQGRKINDIDQDEDITLVNDQDDAEMFDISDLHSKEVFVEREVADKDVNAAGEINAASIATTYNAGATITTKEITLAKALVKIKTKKLRLQAEEQQELTDAEKATLFIQLLEKRRKFFATKRTEEKRNKSPTQARQRKIMCTYLKNVEGKKLKDLKNKSFDSI